MARITQISTLALAAACWLGIIGCSSSSNDPSTVGSTANGSAGSGMAPGASGGASTAVAGANSVAGASASTGGGDSTSAGGGASASTGGGDSTSAGGGDSTSAGGGDSTSAGGMDTGTATGFTPLCAGLSTAAGVAPTKSGACTDADPQLCYKTCGPQSVGYKSETCTAGVYAEQSGCSFAPDLDASCFKIPDAIDASCPTTAPQASSVCNVAACTLCNVDGDYLDSGGTSKAGYCVCPASATGSSKWSCASTTAWPCPAGKGC